MATEITSGAGWRFKVGVVLIAWTILSWLLIPIEAALGMPGATIAATTAGLAIANKIVLLLAIAVMGKPGFQELKAKLFHRLTPAAEVSPTRYRIGLVMFCLPILQGLLETWASHISPELVANRLWVDIVMDGMMIASLFVLGGNFWDKLRAVFHPERPGCFPPGSLPSSLRNTSALMLGLGPRKVGHAGNCPLLARHDLSGISLSTIRRG